MVLFSPALTVVHFIIIIKNAQCNVTTVLDYFINLYGEGYGTEWIYFPDGDGTPHLVSLTGDVQEEADTRGGYNEVEFRLYTRHMNNTQGYIMSETAELMTDINDDTPKLLSNTRLKIITHGWRSSVDSDAVASIKNAYLHTNNVKVITVDWSTTAGSIFYHWVANQTERIGIEVATFMNGLSERYKISGKQIHLIGHSLGAHILGIAAHVSSLKIDRITGLDPARPLIEVSDLHDSLKLDSSDADFVDIIHTCAGVLGIENATGTADFYPNSGIPPQPGCETIPKILEACSHGRAYNYFAESIYTPRAFPAYQCNNWVDYLENRCKQYGYMGENVSRKNTGKYFLKTGPKSPFGRSN